MLDTYYFRKSSNDDCSHHTTCTTDGDRDNYYDYRTIYTVDEDLDNYYDYCTTYIADANHNVTVANDYTAEVGYTTTMDFDTGNAYVGLGNQWNRDDSDDE